MTSSLSPASVPPADDAWQVVENHMHLIKRAVHAAIGRGYLASQDRGARISDARLWTYKLVKRHDPARGIFEHYLAKTLAKNLFRECTRPGRDAWGHKKYSLDHAPGTAVPRYRPDKELLTSEIRSRIAKRIPPRIQAIARMALIDHLSLTKIAHRTGRNGPGPKAELRKILKYCYRRVHGRQGK